MRASAAALEYTLRGAFVKIKYRHYLIVICRCQFLCFNNCTMELEDVKNGWRHILELNELSLQLFCEYKIVPK